MAQANLMGDPTYASYLRALQYNQADAERQAQTRQDLINQQLGLSVPEAREQGVQQRRSIAGSMEDRGVYRSGETQRRMAESRADEQRRVQGLQLAGAMDVAGVQSNLAGTLGRYQMGAGEAYLDALYRSVLDQQQAATPPVYQQPAAGAAGVGASSSYDEQRRAAY